MAYYVMRLEREIRVVAERMGASIAGFFAEIR
jgi:hypothetical protein